MPVRAGEGGEAARPTRPSVDRAETVGGLKQDEADAAPQSTTRGPPVKTPAAAPTGDAFGATDAKLALGRDEVGVSADRRAKDSLVTQLVKQCESAAARNDCVAVRVLAKRIKSADADAYKQRVATNTAIARCLD